ncbi:MAG: dihydropyrimidinase [Chloroflexota bacterium]
MHDLVIRGGALVSASRTWRADLAVAGGTIVEIGAAGPGRREIDASGLLVLPGLVDPHTHIEAQFRPDGPFTADDWLSGSTAAAFGGVTTVIDYARQFPGQTLAEALEAWHVRAAERSVIDYSPHLIVTDFSEATLGEITGLRERGFPSVKVFMMRVSDDQLLRLVRAAAEAGSLLMVHAENGHVLDARREELFAFGRRSARWYGESRPEVGEAEATSRAIDYAALYDARICIVHVSCAAALDRVREGKRRGARVSAEVRPCYLLMDDSIYGRPEINPLEHSGCPPYRPRWNLAELWRGLAEGVLDVVGSDHCSWALREKSVGAEDFSLIPHGIPALETQLPALWTRGVATGQVTANRLVEAMSTGPARLHGLYPRKGALQVGSDADLVLFDPSKRVTIRNEAMHSRTGYEPCEGMVCTGWPVTTIARGEVIVENGELRATPGRGALLTRAATA